MAKRLWDKGDNVNEIVFNFTVGTDPQVDLALLPFDCIGSAAHARMLLHIGLLSEKDCADILAVLKGLYASARKGEVTIPAELEDCHTAIEAELTKKLGEAGQRVHTGRSRNDQVLLCIRLLLRERVVGLLKALDLALLSLNQLYKKSGTLPLPGYTHMMPAMPSSVGMWAHAQYEALLELMRDGFSLLDSMNSNPLGAASGFDVPLPLDRKLVADLLGFDRVQRSVIDVQNSRGRYERKALAFCSEVGAILEKIASDLQLFFMREFGFISLPNSLTTGSSIMPQKRNPDVLELMRATVGKIRGAAAELSWVTCKLPGNYHRDFQLTKEPTIRGLDATQQLLTVLPIVIDNTQWNEAALSAAMHPELYATYGVYARVREGKPFRQAYAEAAKEIAAGNDEFTAYKGDFTMIAGRSEIGWREAIAEYPGVSLKVAEWITKLKNLETSIF